jgi:hypothetical protein
MTLISATQTYTYRLGKYVKGIWTESDDLPGTFEGSIQPLSYKDIQALPAGREDKGKIKIYSDVQLPIGSEINPGTEDIEKTSGAIIDWQGKTWEIIQELSYQMGLISHYKYIAEIRE